ncbi:MAG: DUF6655 family protein [Phenylobacterium sp.]|uniref:DUF6655 family protein n=1 Tax=Phenylobacterium sp. TaxID=1871053 RepID=UPI00391BCF71
MLTGSSPDRRRTAAFAAVLLLAGCATATQTTPGRTATEQLLVAHAAEQAAKKIEIPLPAGSRVFVLPAGFGGEEGQYAISALRSTLANRGYALAQKPEEADVVLEVRKAALSIDEMSHLIGIPSVTLPNIAALSAFTVPELSLYARRDRSGVAEFLLFAYDAKSGKPLHVQDRVVGATMIRAHKALLVFSWGKQEVRPGDPALGSEPWWKVW